MMNVKLMNKIAAVGINALDSDRYTTGDDIAAPDAIMVRSASLHEMELNPELKAIARCGAGVNNIPVEKCAENGVVVFNTPGANANGVKELTVAALMLSSRDIVGGVKWACTLDSDVAKAVEKGKSNFAGCEIKGKTLGVIGLGAIGGMVANTAHSLGMNVVGCDPFITVGAAWKLSRAVKQAATYEDVYKTADYITLHVPATPETKGMINAETIAMMKDGVRIINLARGDLVNVADVKAALESGKIASYVCDFPTEETINVPGIVAIPHLGASTTESEDNCAVMAAQELDDYLTDGNIVNSVNYPSVSMPRTGKCRTVILHKNIPNMISHITGTISAENINIDNMANRSKGDFACTLVDTEEIVSDEASAKISAMEGIIRVIVIK